MRLDFRGGLQSIKRASILAIFYITRETRLELPARGMTLHTDTFLSIEKLLMMSLLPVQIMSILPAPFFNPGEVEIDTDDSKAERLEVQEKSEKESVSR